MSKKIVYICGNNGVTAVMLEREYLEQEHRSEIAREAEKLGKPIEMPPVRPVFTFSDSESHKPYVTGSSTLLQRLLETCEVRRGSIWVPFSNGIQWDPDHDRREHELLFRTNLDQAIDAFGLLLPGNDVMS